MKDFHNSYGHLAGSTMTVGELRDCLEEFQNDMPIFATWEGVQAYIDPDEICIRKVHKGDKSEECDCLVIDVERY